MDKPESQQAASDCWAAISPMWATLQTRRPIGMALVPGGGPQSLRCPGAIGVTNAAKLYTINLRGFLRERVPPLSCFTGGRVSQGAGIWGWGNGH